MSDNGSGDHVDGLAGCPVTDPALAGGCTDADAEYIEVRTVTDPAFAGGCTYRDEHGKLRTL